MSYKEINQAGVRQYYRTRSSTVRSTMMLHTAENAMDEEGADTGAESVARFIDTRSTYGSYHSVGDSDSRIQLAPWSWTAFHCRTNSANSKTASHSFACRASDWQGMADDTRTKFMETGVNALLSFNEYLANIGMPTVPARYITVQEFLGGSDGITTHRLFDPSRRSDPGTPEQFNYQKFIDMYRDALALWEPTMIRGNQAGPWIIRRMSQLGILGFNGSFSQRVIEFQKAKGLTQDGILGPNTKAALMKALEAPPVPDKPKVQPSDLAEAAVRDWYRAALDRAPDQGGLEHWAGLLLPIAQNFVRIAEQEK